MPRETKRAAVEAGPAEGPWALPEGWRWERLGGAFPLSYGKSLPQRERNSEGSVPVYGSSGAVGFHDVPLTSGPAVLVGRKGSAGAVHWSDAPCWPIDTAYFVEARAGLSLRFGYHLLKHLRLDALDQSTAIPSLSRDVYSDQIVPIPPLDIQDAIVARIDELFAEIEAAEEAFGDAEEGFELYSDSVLHAAAAGTLLGGGGERSEGAQSASDLLALLSNEASKRPAPTGRKRRIAHKPEGFLTAIPFELPAGWHWVAVGQIGEVVTGATPPTSRREHYDGGVPFFTPADLDAGRSIETTRRTISLSGLASVRPIPAGAVLVTCIGATIGKVGTSAVDGATNQQINAIVPFHPLLTDYLFAYFSSPVGRSLIIDASASTTLPILNKSAFLKIPVPLPPMGQLQETVEALTTHWSIAASLDPTLVDLKQEPQRLRQSILAAAFRGDLVA